MKLCPAFCIGKCPIIGCNDYNHVKCKFGIICTNKNCKYGHPITFENRVIMSEQYKEFRKVSTEYKPNTGFCKYGMTCMNENCSDVHHFGYEYRCQMRELFIRMHKQEKDDDNKIRMVDVGTMTEPCTVTPISLPSSPAKSFDMSVPSPAKSDMSSATTDDETNGWKVQVSYKKTKKITKDVKKDEKKDKKKEVKDEKKEEKEEKKEEKKEVKEEKKEEKKEVKEEKKSWGDRMEDFSEIEEVKETFKDMLVKST